MPLNIIIRVPFPDVGIQVGLFGSGVVAKGTFIRPLSGVHSNMILKVVFSFTLFPTVRTRMKTIGHNRSDNAN